MSADLSQLGWAAGFVDGEGCIHIARQRYKTGRNDTFQLRLFITQNHLGVLEHFRRVLGVTSPIHELRRTEGLTRPCFTLNYTGKKALRVIELLLPYLVRKTQEAVAAVEFWAIGRVGERSGRRILDPEVAKTRERYYEELKRLKK
jgi:hypothetical protein